MIIKCGECGYNLKVLDGVVDGQHICCPVCGKKFCYRKLQRQAESPRNWSNNSSEQSGKKNALVRNLIVVAVLGTALAAGISQHNRYQRRKVFEERQQAEQERIRVLKEKQENEAEQQREKAAGEARALKEKKDALDTLKAYLSREERLLENVVAESKIDISAVSADQQRMSAELLRIEEVNAERQKEADEKGWSRYDKAERLLLVMKSDVVNQLSVKYNGEDLTALLGEFRSKMKTILKMDEIVRNGLAKNREAYEKSVANIDADVAAKTQLAREQTMDANKDLEKRLSGLEEKRRRKMSQIASLRKQSQSSAVSDEISTLQSEITELDNEISRVSEVVTVSRANLSHIAATEAETVARKKSDSALLVKTESDNAVHAASAHERTVFSIAAQYEAISLERIRNSMKSRTDVLSARMHDAQQKLNYIHRASANADMMNPAEIKKLRARIADRISESIMDAANM